MRSRITLIIASLFGALSIYCAQGALQPEKNANADGSSGSTAGACCDTTPKWTKITEGTLSGKAGPDAQGVSEPIDVSSYKELTLIRKCTSTATSVYATTLWGAESGGLFGTVGSGGEGRFPVVAPILRISVGTDSTSTSASCNYVLVGVK